jgi:hypothetical protein
VRILLMAHVCINSSSHNNARPPGHQLDAVLGFQFFIQRIAVIRLVLIISPGTSRVKRCSSVVSTSLVSVGEALATLIPTGRPWRSAITMILVPLPRFVLPTPEPLFRPNEGAIHKGLTYVRLASLPQISHQGPKNLYQRTVLLPLLKLAMTGLIGRITFRQILPGCPPVRNTQSTARASWAGRPRFSNFGLGLKKGPVSSIAHLSDPFLLFALNSHYSL